MEWTKDNYELWWWIHKNWRSYEERHTPSRQRGSSPTGKELAADWWSSSRGQVTWRHRANKAASTRSVSDGSHSLNTAKYGHKAALFLSPALFHESLTSVGWRIAAHQSQSRPYHTGRLCRQFLRLIAKTSDKLVSARLFCSCSLRDICCPTLVSSVTPAAEDVCRSRSYSSVW